MADNTLSHLFEEAVHVTTDDLTYRLDPGEIDLQEPQGKEPSKRPRLPSKDGDGKRMTKEYSTSPLPIKRVPGMYYNGEVKFDKSPFWVRISGIPPFYWTKTDLEELAAKVSPNDKLPKYIDFERGSFGMGTVRFRATIDIHKPLFSGFFMKREAIKDLWLQFKYEKLPKLCLKCGIISHAQKFCFKLPTLIKDHHGAFFPMFGAWMKHEELARSPFSSPLPNWFEEWIIQKRLTDTRETRRQLLGKRRLVEQVMEELPATNEIRVSHFSMVTLPGVGEVCPLEDTATLVVPQGHENLLVLDPQNDKHDGDSTIGPKHRAS
ncbi:hypothetical protein F8388_019690 [Cannabis sativa]|uniref:Zinc knuckle CX2CX4HX4C domain-containing protein n=1 Tax=Cannabis sativa TaxID=3483 RepID=A0A7J6FJ76_CANSA|nr:hypothetical protein F8388_019690 [Cannabis sativa]